MEYNFDKPLRWSFYHVKAAETYLDVFSKLPCYCVPLHDGVVPLPELNYLASHKLDAIETFLLEKLNTPRANCRFIYGAMSESISDRRIVFFDNSAFTVGDVQRRYPTCSIAVFYVPSNLRAATMEHLRESITMWRQLRKLDKIPSLSSADPGARSRILVDEGKVNKLDDATRTALTTYEDNGTYPEVGHWYAAAEGTLPDKSAILTAIKTFLHKNNDLRLLATDIRSARTLRSTTDAAGAVLGAGVLAATVFMAVPAAAPLAAMWAVSTTSPTKEFVQYSCVIAHSLADAKNRFTSGEAFFPSATDNRCAYTIAVGDFTKEPVKIGSEFNPRFTFSAPGDCVVHLQDTGDVNYFRYILVTHAASSSSGEQRSSYVVYDIKTRTNISEGDGSAKIIHSSDDCILLQCTDVIINIHAGIIQTFDGIAAVGWATPTMSVAFTTDSIVTFRPDGVIKTRMPFGLTGIDDKPLQICTVAIGASGTINRVCTAADAGDGTADISLFSFAPAPDTSVNVKTTRVKTPGVPWATADFDAIMTAANVCWTVPKSFASCENTAAADIADMANLYVYCYNRVAAELAISVATDLQDAGKLYTAYAARSGQTAISLAEFLTQVEAKYRAGSADDIIALCSVHTISNSTDTAKKTRETLANSTTVVNIQSQMELALQLVVWTIGGSRAMYHCPAAATAGFQDLQKALFQSGAKYSVPCIENLMRQEHTMQCDPFFFKDETVRVAAGEQVFFKVTNGDVTSEMLGCLASATSAELTFTIPLGDVTEASNLLEHVQNAEPNGADEAPGGAQESLCTLTPESVSKWANARFAGWLYPDAKLLQSGKRCVLPNHTLRVPQCTVCTKVPATHQRVGGDDPTVATVCDTCLRSIREPFISIQSHHIEGHPGEEPRLQLEGIINRLAANIGYVPRLSSTAQPAFKPTVHTPQLFEARGKAFSILLEAPTAWSLVEQLTVIVAGHTTPMLMHVEGYYVQSTRFFGVFSAICQELQQIVRADAGTAVAYSEDELVLADATALAGAMVNHALIVASSQDYGRMFKDKEAVKHALKAKATAMYQLARAISQAPAGQTQRSVTFGARRL